ncbi:MAG: GNAT family N-acetyltransferase [SAR202 cluster bacterium]|nr:GNAT family N-acetyltransferase [SAR202 cluster bacterium]
MQAAIVIRPCSRREIPDLLALWRESARATHTDSPEGVAPLFDGRAADVLVAETDGRIVGGVIAAFDGWRGNVYRLAVHPRYRLRGIATALVNEAERYLRRRGAKRLAAVVDGASLEAQDFWDAMAARHGWKVTHPGARYAKTV